MRQQPAALGKRGRSAPKRPPGRPRSEQARLAILRSTLKLLGENGFLDLTIEAVAAHASVGKATVYRWWPNKAALIADAFASSTTRTLHFPERFMKPRRQEAYATLRRGIRRGELHADVDMDLLLDSLYGPIYMRLLS